MGTRSMENEYPSNSRFSELGKRQEQTGMHVVAVLRGHVGEDARAPVIRAPLS
jgi:arginine/ornithine N-succinyltransferase beta subunit